MTGSPGRTRRSRSRVTSTRGRASLTGARVPTVLAPARRTRHTDAMAATAAVSAPAPRASTRLARIGNEALYLLTGTLAACAAFCVWVTGLTLSLSLGLLII